MGTFQIHSGYDYLIQPEIADPVTNLKLYYINKENTTFDCMFKSNDQTCVEKLFSYEWWDTLYKTNNEATLPRNCTLDEQAANWATSACWMARLRTQEIRQKCWITHRKAILKFNLLGLVNNTCEGGIARIRFFLFHVCSWLRCTFLKRGGNMRWKRLH